MTETPEDARGDAAPQPWRVWLFLLRLALRHPFLLGFSLLASLGVAAAGVLSISLVFPFLESLGGPAAALDVPADFPLAFFTPLFAGMDVAEKIRAIALLLVGIQAARGALSYAESRLTAYLKILVEQDLRQMVFDELMDVQLGWLQRERQANLFNMMHTYPTKTATIVDQYLGGVTKVFTGASFVVVLLLLSWQLTLVALALAAVSMLLVNRLTGAVKALTRRINESRVRLHQTSFETLQAMRLIRTFAREDHAKARFLNDVRAMRRDSFRRSSLSSAMPQVQAVLNMALFALLVVIATFVLDLSSGAWLLQLTMFIIVMSRLMTPVVSFTRKRTQILDDIPSVEELMRFLQAEKPRLKDGDRPFDRLASGVRFERVSYAYAPGQPLVLRDVTLDVPRGAKVALVGPSGSGKSTVLALLSRLADPASGRVLVDGHDVRTLRARTWRARVAVVSQESFLFNDTVRANILYGKPDATSEEVERAARLANAHEFIAAMEQGYDTIVGDRGSRLSGGQAQRIAIARAILADPDVLVLDEATSALDAGTEKLVQEAVDRASRDRTVVAVAHRLATVRDADRIYVLDQGRVVQQGTHQELVAQQGLYRRLVELQDLSGAKLPEAAAATPLRVVFRKGSLKAVLRNGGAPEVEAAVAVATGRADAERRLAASTVPTVVVYPGGERALVRVDGHDQREAEMFEDAPGGERPLRVRAVR